MPAPDESLLGKTLDEYRIDKPLGKGGMARVYRALDTRLRRHVALKVIAPQLKEDTRYTLRFEREAQSIARLEHPHIVRIYRFGEVDGLYYIAMQYVEGADLGQIIAEYGRNAEIMPMADILRIVETIGSALDYAHSKDVIHRDVKPGNIIVDNSGNAILTDFGLALLGDLGTQGEAFGSPYYIAPEQVVSSGSVVPQSDLYGLGITIFEMLTGELPFGKGDPVDMAMRHLSETPPRPSLLNPALSSDIDDVVLRCLEKEPHMRYQTGAELSAALHQAIGNMLQPGITPNSEVRRSSLVAIPERVRDLMQASPLPEVTPDAHSGAVTKPSRLPGEVDKAQPEPSFVANAQRATQPRTVQQAPLPGSPAAGNGPPTIPAARTLRTPLMIVGALLVLGLIAITIALLAMREITSSPSAPTNIAVAPTAPQTPSPLPQIATALPTSIPATPTEPPTPTAVVLVQPVTSPSPILLSTTPPPVAILATPAAVPPTPVAIIPTQIPIPPANRLEIPAGSRRLGEFAVEAYCNNQGYGVRLENNQTDWACINRSNQSIAFILQPPDFDKLCQARYGNPYAFAIRDMTKPIQAYNWSCYEYVAILPTVVPTLPTLAPLLATPSINTLRVVARKDWIAFVNVSNITLSLADFRLEREGDVLPGDSWGQAVLEPGQCLRIYKGNPPRELPTGCNTVLDLNLPSRTRERWLKGEVFAILNPSARIRYKLE